MSHSFTLKSSAVMRALITKLGICAAFDPKNTPNPKPAFVDFDAVWDTGATNSVVSQRVVDACGLKPIGMAKVSTAGGDCMCEVFLVNMRLPNHVAFANIRVTKADMGNTDVLIGMNIITKGDFALTHKDGRTCFSFRLPSSETIDFVKPNPIVSKPHQARNDRCACNSGKKYKHCCGAGIC